ncbi:MAG TPA: DUF465 domain-containing protein [Candidatus Polarisedimenticolia bacterium]|jgi:uncharacterized protein YdcH (DUF465 family)|nr:DUF465 domain-containing protein [Candidatus Polarisedimenticolia bacterium]
METDLRELRELLQRENVEFRALMESHASCEVRLQELQGKGFLNESEKLEEVTIKKKKLHLKDKMESILRHYRNDDLATSGPR